MARIRTIKPDAFASDSLSELTHLSRWTFAGLWTYCDDEGRARADIRLIMAALFPLDDSVTIEILEMSLRELAGAGSICFYEVDGKDYLHCPKWKSHQRINRPTKSKFPPCPEHERGDDTSLTASSVSDHGGLTVGKEQGTGKGKEAAAALAAEFDTFYDIYPRKAGRAAAAKSYAKARQKTSAENLKESLTRQLAWFSAQLKTEGDFRPHAATWLNQERWGDVLDAPQAAGRSSAWDRARRNQAGQ